MKIEIAVVVHEEPFRLGRKGVGDPTAMADHRGISRVLPKVHNPDHRRLLSADVGREVDVCLIDRTRLKPVIEGSGERWIA